MTAAPQSWASHSWHTLAKIVAAVAVGIWLPVRIMLYNELLTADFVLDGVMMVVAGLSVRRALREGADLWDVAGDLLIAMPLVSALHPILGPSAEVFFLGKLMMLRQMWSIRDLLDRLDNLHPVLARIIPLMFIMPMVVHIIACGWVLLGSGNAEPTNDRIFEYGRAVYWAVTTLCTVGYGDIAAKTLWQMAYANVTMVIGIAFFGYVLSNVASLLARLDAAREHHTAVIDRVESFMRYNQVPSSLRSRVRAYYRYVWESHNGYEDEEILKALPRKLRSEVAHHLHSEIISKVPILAGAERELLDDIVLELKPSMTVPGERLFRFGEPGDAMYFIRHGVVDIVSQEGDVLATFTDGGFFGETALLTSNHRNASALAQTYCDLYTLKRESFERVLKRYPQFRDHVQEIVRGRQERRKTAA